VLIKNQEIKQQNLAVTLEERKLCLVDHDAVIKRATEDQRDAHEFN
jgi:hypothetical protein